jgi:polysaccharide biosynthesis/export protein
VYIKAKIPQPVKMRISLQIKLAKYFRQSLLIPLISFLVILCFLQGCISNEKVVYLQDLGYTKPVATKGNLVPYVYEEYIFQYNDIVDISIKTSDEKLNEMFNLSSSQSQMRMMGGGLMSGGDIFFLNGYTINENGKIDLPFIGEVHLEGLTPQKSKELIEEKVREFVTEGDYYVRVRLGGIRYSALGEFNNPGKFTILQNRVTIFEAIANAGEMTTLAKKSEVHLIRQYPEGSRRYIVNLNHDGIMGSEFYFLRPNDLLYAEPMKVRELGTGTTFLQSFQLVITTLTVVLLIVNATK